MKSHTQASVEGRPMDEVRAVLVGTGGPESRG
jgi:hypothetical protein